MYLLIFYIAACLATDHWFLIKLNIYGQFHITCSDNETNDEFSGVNDRKSFILVPGLEGFLVALREPNMKPLQSFTPEKSCLCYICHVLRGITHMMGQEYRNK